MDIKGALLDAVHNLTEAGTDPIYIKGKARVAVMAELYDMDEAELRESIEASFSTDTTGLDVIDLRGKAMTLIREYLKTVYSGGR